MALQGKMFLYLIPELVIARIFYGGICSPNKLDRDCNGDGIVLCIREDIPSKLIEINRFVERVFIEPNLRKNK